MRENGRADSVAEAEATTDIRREDVQRQANQNRPLPWQEVSGFR